MKNSYSSAFPFALLPLSVWTRSSARHFQRTIEVWLLWFTTIVLGVSLLSGCAKTPVPTDPVTTGCFVSATEFKTWFETVQSTVPVTLDAVVKPADSVNFPDTPNCSFYKWSEQMFLWLNSPAPPTYGGGGGRIFNSPAFYDVSPLDANFDRTLIPHPSGSSTLGNLSLRAAQVGPHGLPVIMDKRGTMLEIERPQVGPTGKQLILSDKGDPVEIERITMGENKKPIFFDKTGNVIPGAKPLVQKSLQDVNQALIAQRFTVDKIQVLLGPSGNVIDVEQGQADGSILMAQNGSLVYYQAMVNDVYAYFLTGVKTTGAGKFNPTPTRFPTTSGDLTLITNFAINFGGKPSPNPFPDPEALAIEVKTAWVEAAGLTNPGNYIIMTATIPTYDGPPASQHPNTTIWTPNGQKTVPMALVGMHVVGSTGGQFHSGTGITGHPEMIWATFEHENNAPNAKYNYDSTSILQPVKTVNPTFSAPYLFCAATPNLSTLNQPHMTEDPNPLNPGGIAALSGFTISPSNTIRGNPWGANAGVAPNPVPNIANASVTRSNSELISINNNVRGMLNSNDVRNKYIMTGATWTIFGGGFNGNFGKPGNVTTATGTAVGTSQMANTTMETYQQALDPTTHNTTFNTFSNNCFSCHGTNTTSVSHIFSTPGHPPQGLKPLF